MRQRLQHQELRLPLLPEYVNEEYFDMLKELKNEKRNNNKRIFTFPNFDQIIHSSSFQECI